MSYWDQEKVKLLKKFWAAGLSASAIAQKLGGNATRNSVIGKSHRLNLEARVKSKRPTPKTNIENNSTPEIKTQRLGRKAKFKALLLDTSFPPEQPTKLEDLTDETCRWPLGPKLEPASFFCGRKPVESKNSGKKFPYCELHLLYGYVSKSDKGEDQINEEEIPQFIEKKVKSA